MDMWSGYVEQVINDPFVYLLHLSLYIKSLAQTYICDSYTCHCFEIYSRSPLLSHRGSDISRRENDRRRENAYNRR
jgi:hypothetical protein